MSSNGDTKKEGRTPRTVEQKLERQLNSVKSNMFSLSANPENWTVKEDKTLGTYFVLLVGKGEKGKEDLANHFIIHRLIGSDFRIDKDKSWVMSQARDIAGFLMHAEDPGKPKAMKLLKQIKTDVAVASKVLEIGPDGTEKYPGGVNRQEALDLAYAASTAHGKIKGGNHFGEWILYLPPSLVKKELAIQDATVGNPEYNLRKMSILSEMLIYQTRLVDGKVQKSVPRLYDVPESDVIRTLYQGFFGDDAEVGKPPEFSSGTLLHKEFSDYKPGNDQVRQELVLLLQSAAEAQKAFNVADSLKRQTKKKDMSADITDRYDLTKDRLEEITRKVLAAETKDGYPTISSMMKYEVSINPKLTVEEARNFVANQLKGFKPQA